MNPRKTLASLDPRVVAALRQAHAAQVPVATMARLLRRADATVRRWLAELGLTAPTQAEANRRTGAKRAAATDETVSWLVDRYRANPLLQIAPLARAAGVPAQRLRDALRRAGVATHPRRTVVPAGRIADMCARYTAGTASSVTLAEEFGCSPDYIVKLLRRHGITPRGATERRQVPAFRGRTDWAGTTAGPAR